MQRGTCLYQENRNSDAMIGELTRSPILFSIVIMSHIRPVKPQFLSTILCGLITRHRVTYGESRPLGKEKRMDSKIEEVLNDIAKEIYGKVYDDLRAVEQDEVYCIAEDSGLV